MKRPHKLFEANAISMSIFFSSVFIGCMFHYYRNICILYFFFTDVLLLFHLYAQPARSLLSVCVYSVQCVCAQRTPKRLKECKTASQQQHQQNRSSTILNKQFSSWSELSVSVNKYTSIANKLISNIKIIYNIIWLSILYFASFHILLHYSKCIDAKIKQQHTCWKIVSLSVRFSPFVFCSLFICLVLFLLSVIIIVYCVHISVVS